MTTAWPALPAESFDALALQQLLTTRVFGRTLEVFTSTTSTNDVLKTLAQQGAPEGTVVLAEHQTQGRGRYGRTFASPAGVGLYLSILLRPRIETARLPQLTFMTAVATADALVAHSALPVRLKWPNDVEIAGKKVAGILSEVVLNPPAPPAVILGIGINVNTTLAHLPPALHQHVTSLALEADHAWPRGPLMAALLSHCEHWHHLWQQGEYATILQTWLRYSAIIGRQVAFPHEPQTDPALVVGLDHDGALLVQQATGALRRVVAGEVAFV